MSIDLRSRCRVSHYINSVCYFFHLCAYQPAATSCCPLMISFSRPSFHTFLPIIRSVLRSYLLMHWCFQDMYIPTVKHNLTRCSASINNWFDALTPLKHSAESAQVILIQQQLWLGNKRMASGWVSKSHAFSPPSLSTPTKSPKGTHYPEKEPTNSKKSTVWATESLLPLPGCQHHFVVIRWW